MLNLRKHVRLAVPVGAALVAAAAVGGPALASTASTSAKAHAAATSRGARGPRGHTGHTGPRGLQGPQGPAGAAGSNGAQGAAGTNGTAAGGGAEAAILYAANPATTAPNTPAGPPTVIYSGHGLAFSASCTSSGPVLKLETSGGNAISINGTVPTTPAGSPTPAVTTALNNYSMDLSTNIGAANTVTFASTDGAVVELHFVTSSTQTGAQCFVFGTRIGG